MNRLARTRLATVTAAVSAAVMVLAAVPGHAADEQPAGDRLVVPAFGTMRADADTKVQEIKVSWSGDGDRDYVQSARVEGIGNIKLVCKPENTIIKLTADDRVPETQMWLAKYETKNGANVVSVKNARIYKYANTSATWWRPRRCASTATPTRSTTAPAAPGPSPTRASTSRVTSRTGPGATPTGWSASAPGGTNPPGPPRSARSRPTT